MHGNSNIKFCLYYKNINICMSSRKVSVIVVSIAIHKQKKIIYENKQILWKIKTQKGKARGEKTVQLLDKWGGSIINRNTLER